MVKGDPSEWYHDLQASICFVLFYLYSIIFISYVPLGLLAAVTTVELKLPHSPCHKVLVPGDLEAVDQTIVVS